MKYINAGLLRKDIDNWKEAIANAVGEYSDGVRFALEHFTFVLDSLQQDQSDVDLEKQVIYETTISADKTIPVLPMKDVSDMGFNYGDKVIVQIRKK